MVSCPQPHEGQNSGHRDGPERGASRLWSGA